LLSGAVHAQNNSPAKSGNSSNAAAPQVTTAESVIVILDGFGYQYNLVRQNDGSYRGEMPIGSPGQWTVTGRVNSGEFEIHAVNPASEHGSGFCQSFLWSGSRSGATVTGTVFNEATDFNTAEGCGFNATDTGTIVYSS
jgi:hypothetical protein